MSRKRKSSRSRERRSSTPAPSARQVASAPNSIRPEAREREPSRGTIAVRRALDRLAMDVPTAVTQRSRRPVRSNSARPQSARLDPGALSARRDRVSLRPDDRTRAEPKLQPNLRPDRCKPKPRSSRGSGGSRPFVPWCKK